MHCFISTTWTKMITDSRSRACTMDEQISFFLVPLRTLQHQGMQVHVQHECTTGTTWILPLRFSTWRTMTSGKDNRKCTWYSLSILWSASSCKMMEDKTNSSKKTTENYKQFSTVGTLNWLSMTANSMFPLWKIALPSWPADQSLISVGFPLCPFNHLQQVMKGNVFTVEPIVWMHWKVFGQSEVELAACQVSWTKCSIQFAPILIGQRP